MVPLKQVAKVVRSKNAGPWNVTFDIMFEDSATYEHIKRSKVLTAAVIAKLYGVPENRVLFTEYDPAYSIKATIPRKVSCGDPEDTDVYAGQQHVPLMELPVEPLRS